MTDRDAAGDRLVEELEYYASKHPSEWYAEYFEKAAARITALEAELAPFRKAAEGEETMLGILSPSERAAIILHKQITALEAELDHWKKAAGILEETINGHIAALAALEAEKRGLVEALVMYDDKAKDVQDHWSDPGSYTHNALLTAQLVHGDTVASARAALARAKGEPQEKEKE